MQMNANERLDFIRKLEEMPEKDRNFILGYAAGVIAQANEKAAKCSEKAENALDSAKTNGEGAA